MDTTTENKLSELVKGERAIALQVDELEQIEQAGYPIRTVYNADAIGTRSAPYVGWMAESPLMIPPGFRRDPDTGKCQGRAGPLVATTDRTLRRRHEAATADH